MGTPANVSTGTGGVADRQLDVRGRDCPVPALEARRVLDGMPHGQVLEVQATDPLAGVDLQVLCDRLGHDLLSAAEQAGVLYIRIRVSRARRAGAG